jgi:hypothetical protein
MKRYLIIVASAAALCVPAAALAADATPNASQLALQSCKTQQTQLGATFNTTYGTNASKSNAFGKCVSKAMHAAQAAIQNASQQCQAEAADTNFASTHSGQTFAQVYGSGNGKNAGANAMGKCVSTKAHAANDARTAAVIKAAKACKAARTANATTFAQTYSSLGACVSAKTKSS